MVIIGIGEDEDEDEDEDEEEKDSARAHATHAFTHAFKHAFMLLWRVCVRAHACVRVCFMRACIYAFTRSNIRVCTCTRSHARHPRTHGCTDPRTHTHGMQARHTPHAEALHEGGGVSGSAHHRHQEQACAHS